MTDTSKYSARYREQYREGSFETVLVPIRRRQVIDSIRAYRGRRIVEVGCGLEPLFPFMDDFESFTIVEPVPEFADAAREQASGDPRIEVLQAPLEEVVAEIVRRGESPDLIIASSLLHEVANPRSILQAVRQLSGVGTVAHFNVPNIRSLHRLLAVEMGLIPTVFTRSELEERFQRRTQYDLESLTTAVESVGFQVVDSGSYFLKPFTHEQMGRMLAEGIIDSRTIDGLISLTRHLPGLGAEIYVNATRGTGSEDAARSGT